MASFTCKESTPHITLKNTIRRRRLGLVKPSAIYRLFYPEVPVVICARSDEKVAAMPANSCSSVSDSPPMISVAVKRSANTNKVIRRSSMFSINWLNFKSRYSRNIVQKLSTPSSKGVHDKLQFNNIPYTLALNTPILKHVFAYAICRVVKLLTTGDHDVFIARVTKAMALRDFTDDGYWRFKDYKPILYIGSIRRDPLVTME